MQHVLATQSMDTIQRHIQILKAFLRDTFHAYCETDLYTLKVDLLDYGVKNLNSSQNLELLSSSAHERFNVHIKQTYRLTLQNYTPAVEETSSAVIINTRTRKQEKHEAQMTMKTAVAEELDHVSATPHFLSGAASKAVPCIAKLCRRSASWEAPIMWPRPCWHCWNRLPREHSSVFLKGVTRALCSQSRKDIQLKFVQAGYVHGGLFSELLDQGTDNRFITKSFT